MKKKIENNENNFFIASDVQEKTALDKISEQITKNSIVESNGLYFSGVLELPEFLTEEGRQFLEGQIFAYGKDIRKVCHTVNSHQCPDEITVPHPEDQIPVIGDFAREFNSFARNIVPWNYKRTVFQLRVYQPRYGGHPEHVDYEPGFTKLRGDKSHSCLTSLSFSMPISWNNGKAPAFKLFRNDEIVLQDIPGSLVLFGPKVTHGHPSAPDLCDLYAWLIAQTFYEAPF